MNTDIIFLRQLNIDLVTGDYNPIIKTFEDIWRKLHVAETDVFHQNGGEFIYYIIDKDIRKYVFFMDDENDIFCCSYSDYWQAFVSNFNLNYSEMQIVTKVLVERELNNIKPYPNYLSKRDNIHIQHSLNKIIGTPHQVLSIHHDDLVNVFDDIKKVCNE